MSKQRYVIQTNQTGGATFRIPLDKEGTVDDAMLLISPRMSSILKTEVRVRNVLVAKTNLFEEDVLQDVVDADEMIFVELVEAGDSSSIGDESKYIDMSEDSKTSDDKSDDKGDDKAQRGSQRVSASSSQRISAEPKHSEHKESSSSSSQHRADDLFYKSFAASLQTHLVSDRPASSTPSPASALASLREQVALASTINRAQRSLGGGGGDEKQSTPSMCLVSFLSTWATSFGELMKEARTCFDFHHLSHADEELLLPTPVHIYEEWLLEVPSLRTHGSISLVTYFRELETLKAEEVESAAYIDAFAAALHASPHDLNSEYALAERVHASRGSGSSSTSGSGSNSTALYKWAMEFLVLFKEVKTCSDFFQLAHTRKDQPSGSRRRPGGCGLTPASAFEEWSVEVPDSDGVGLVEKNLLGWYWDLQRTRERETDAEQYLDSFATAVSVPVAVLKNNLSRADALLRRHGGDHGAREDPENAHNEKERTWATYYVQLMKEVKTCFVFDQLAHGNDRMKPNTTSERVYQAWTIDVDVINSATAGCRVGRDQDQVLCVGLVQWFHDISALAL